MIEKTAREVTRFKYKGAIRFKKLQRKRGPNQRSDQINSQVMMAEPTNKTQEEHLHVQFIPYLQSEMIPAFEESLCR